MQVRTGAHVTDVQPGYVMVGDERIESVCTLWAAGVQASPLGKMLADSLGMPTASIVAVASRSTSISTLRTTRKFLSSAILHTLKKTDKQIPGTAPPAMQMGMYAANRIGLLATNPAAAARQKPFHYFDKGDMATIGRKAAVARIAWPFHAHWSGFLAWFTWLVVHIFFLIGFRNRIGVSSASGRTRTSASRTACDLSWAHRIFRDGMPGGVAGASRG